MKIVLIIQVLIYLSFYSCGTSMNEVIIINENYELIIAKRQKAVLILFPCYPCDISHTKREAPFLKSIGEKGITTILMNFNKKLYLTKEEKFQVSQEIKSIFEINKIKSSNVFLGGFSSGGNVALILSEYLFSENSNLKIKGVFVVDSPIDLEQLYKNAKNDITLNANDGAKNEGIFLSELLKNELGNPIENLTLYKESSPFLVSQTSLENLRNHREYKIRLYTEPSIEWHLKNRKREYDNTNSWMIEKFYETLKINGNNSCDIIKTENKGIRANGDIHPHSWSIVEQKGLLEWMK